MVGGAQVGERAPARQGERMEEGTPLGRVEFEVPERPAAPRHPHARRRPLQLRLAEGRDGRVGAAAHRLARDQLVEDRAHVVVRVAAAVARGGGHEALDGPLRVGRPFAQPRRVHREEAALDLEEAGGAVHGGQHGRLVPGATPAHALLLGLPRKHARARRQGFGEEVVDGVRIGVGALGDRAARIDVPAERPVRDDDRRGPPREGDLRGGPVVHRVVLLPLRHPARHHVPGAHLALHEFAAVERRVAVALRLQEAAHVREEADRAEDDAPVGRGGERPAVDVVRVRRVVRVEVLHPVGVGLREARELPVPGALRVPARHADDAQLLRAAHRDAGPPVVGVDDLDGGDGLVVARAGGHREDFALPLVRQRVEARERPHVVIVLHHVGVEEDPGPCGESRERHAGGQRKQSVFHHAASIPHPRPPRKECGMLRTDYK